MWDFYPELKDEHPTEILNDLAAFYKNRHLNQLSSLLAYYFPLAYNGDIR
jgi:hypothetical protein